MYFAVYIQNYYKMYVLKYSYKLLVILTQMGMHILRSCTSTLIIFIKKEQCSIIIKAIFKKKLTQKWLNKTSHIM